MQLLFEIKDAHAGAVTILLVCPASGDVASIGGDRRVVVYRENTRGTGLVKAGVIEEVPADTRVQVSQPT